MVLRLKLAAKPAKDGPAHQVIGAVERMGFYNPLNDRELVFGGVKVELRAADPQRLRISSFDAMQPRAGTGTTALLRLIALADLYGSELELDANPYGGRDEMSKEALQAWYADRGGFLPETEGETAMLRMPQTRDALPGLFYGVAKPEGEALTDATLAALGLQSERAADGGFHFRGPALAVRELLLHAADFTLGELAFRPDDAPLQPFESMTYAQRKGELACVRWRLAHGEGSEPELRQQLTALQQLTSPQQGASAGAEPERTAAPNMRCASCGWTNHGSSDVQCYCGGRLFRVAASERNDPEADGWDSVPW
ncbi:MULTISPECIES: hypothetical protein [Cupriavidus]